MRLQGILALITGGGSGFGAGIAQLFATEGAQVLVADIDGDRAKAGAGQIERCLSQRLRHC